MSKMKQYLDKLDALSPDQTLLKSSKVLLFLSGSSHLESASLTSGQLEFLEQICPPDFSVVPSNFPFNQGFEHGRQTQVALLAASISNIRYYWYTLYNSRFQEALQRHLSPLLDAEEAVIICKSSGLNMLTQWLEGLGEENLPIRLRVIALGPVSRRLLNRKDIDLLVIKGRKDIYSRCLDSHPADVMVYSNHFDYEYREDVKGLVDEWIRQSDKD
ncbi:hypothetical protein MK370_01400 [Streptococcus sanguinis]|uniref:hypothetical protein n=1 Tax=Streptococcus sanguinis TaxID=1305 RepID=UPI002283341D|nr:hypothetical protein [Streptococcus sanguinis]MCY7040199.1 hypothetical protein [Streptococcus sanguinis]